jgi:hypothetical protein
VLTPVYGPQLHFGEHALAGGRMQPFVMPWRGA